MNAASEALILVADDNEVARYTKSRLMRAAGFRVIEASTGAQTLEAVRKELPDLVLLDVKMPDIDGYEVCRRLRADPLTASLAIVQISASFRAPQDRVRGLEGGADTFLVAPAEPEELIATVRAMLRLRRAEQAARDNEVRLRDIIEKLNEADRHKDEFLATLSHELRNPLAPIRHAVQIAAMPNASEAQRRWANEVIDRQSRQMARLLDDLLEISRISRGKIELRKERTDLTTALQSALETARPLIDERNHTVDAHLPQQPICLDADPVRLAQIFANLLTNAAKYTEPQGRISIDVERTDGFVTVAIRDTGIGLDPAMLPRIFEMFSQAHATGERLTTDGLGIGLALVRGLVEMHGGTVEARSEGCGKGSEFTVRLPVLAETSV